MESLKLEIKKLAEEQKILKNQKKTVNLVGQRTIEPWKAIFQHSQNRIKLREMYMAYGLLKGKTQEQIETNPKTPINLDNVNEIIKQYEKVICIDQI